VSGFPLAPNLAAVLGVNASTVFGRCGHCGRRAWWSSAAAGGAGDPDRPAAQRGGGEGA